MQRKTEEGGFRCFARLKNGTVVKKGEKGKGEGMEGISLEILKQCSSPGEYSQKIGVGVCGPLHKTLTISMTKICDFPYPIYDPTKNLIPYL